MKDKQFDPAKNNEKAPAPGMAAVNTHNPGEEPIEQPSNQKQERSDTYQQDQQSSEKINEGQ
jgi:hypothetical protein